MTDQDTYNKLFPTALYLAVETWLDDDDPRHGYDYEQNVKSVKDALRNTWTDDLAEAQIWASRAVSRLRPE